MRAPQEGAHRRHAIVLRGRPGRGPVRGPHRAELVDHERPASLPDPRLAVEDRAAVPLDQQGEHEDERREDGRHHRGDREVEQPRERGARAMARVHEALEPAVVDRVQRDVPERGLVEGGELHQPHRAAEQAPRDGGEDVHPRRVGGDQQQVDVVLADRHDQRVERADRRRGRIAEVAALRGDVTEDLEPVVAGGGEVARQAPGRPEAPDDGDAQRAAAPPPERPGQWEGQRGGQDEHDGRLRPREAGQVARRGEQREGGGEEEGAGRLEREPDEREEARAGRGALREHVPAAGHEPEEGRERHAVGPVRGQRRDRERDERGRGDERERGGGDFLVGVQSRFSHGASLPRAAPPRRPDVRPIDSRVGPRR